MSADKYLSIFSRQMEAIVYLISKTIIAFLNGFSLEILIEKRPSSFKSRLDDVSLVLDFHSIFKFKCEEETFSKKQLIFLFN